MAWTTPATLVTGAVIQASWANTHVRDNERYLKGLDGAVAIQDSMTITGSASASVGVNVGSESGALTGEIKALTGRFAGFPGVTGGVAAEIGVSGGICLVQGFDRTGGVFVDTAISGLVVIFRVSGFEAGRVNATGFSGDGSQLTALNASYLASGTVPDARLSSNVAFSGENVSQFTNNSNYLIAATENTSTSGRAYTVDVSLANEATNNLCADSAGGWFFITVPGTNIFGLVYSAAGATTNIALDPSSQFSNTGIAAGKTNIGLSGGFVQLYNKTGSTCAYRVVRLAGG